MKIANKMKLAVLGLTLAVGGAAMPIMSTSAIVTCMDGQTASNWSDCFKESRVMGGSNDKNINFVVKDVVNTFIGVIGFLAVVMIIYGGFLYTTSAGDSSKVTKAKNAIMYGVIGLVVAILAFAIVNFVLTSLIK